MGKTERDGSWVGVIIPLSISAFCVIGATVYLVMAADSLTWPTVDGEIIGTRVERRETPDPDRPQYPDIYFEPVVHYRYSVEGKDYESHRLALYELDFQTRAGAEERVASFTRGKKVTVHHSPDDPAVAVLETGWDPTALFGMLGFALLGAFFGFSELATLRRELKEEGTKKGKAKGPGKNRGKRKKKRT